MSELLSGSRAAQGLRIEHALPGIKAKEPDSHRRLYEAVRYQGGAAARAEMRRHLEIAHGWEQQVAALREQAAIQRTQPIGVS
jgi:DNA-binding FadR family transcriptional regulator